MFRLIVGCAAASICSGAFADIDIEKAKAWLAKGQTPQVCAVQYIKPEITDLVKAELASRHAVCDPQETSLALQSYYAEQQLKQQQRQSQDQAKEQERLAQLRAEEDRKKAAMLLIMNQALNPPKFSLPPPPVPAPQINRPINCTSTTTGTVTNTYCN